MSVLETTLFMSGEVSTFNDTAFRADILAAFPAAVDCAIAVSAASVKVDVRLIFPSESEASEASATVASAESDPSVATAWFNAFTSA